MSAQHGNSRPSTDCGGMVGHTPDIAKFFFEIGYAACWADAFIKNDETPPFKLTDTVVERAWDIAPECHEDGGEFDRYKAMADAANDLLEDAEFLCARLRELECDILDDEVGRQYYGHVAPARGRLEAAISKALGESTHD